MLILPTELLPKPKRSEQGTDRTYSWFKRAFDVVMSIVLLVVLSPVFVLTAVLIKLDSRGSVLYAQERIGLNRRRSGEWPPPDQSERRSADAFGRPFRMFKFRTMVVDAEKSTGPVWAKVRDPRVTRLGRILRHTHFDETPQLWNVLRGEMSLVGPRPERPTFVVSLAEAIPDYPQRCRALPGITGLAQVKSEYDSSLETVNRKLKYDLYYVRYGRLLLDFKIMAATFGVVARGVVAH